MRQYRASLIVVAMICLPLLCATSAAHALGCDAIKNRIRLAQDWFVEAQQENGLFFYEYRPIDNAFSADNNIVRQTGSFWALIESLRHADNPETRAAIENFRTRIAGMIRRTKAHEEDIAFVEFENFGKVNTASLYLLSLLELQENGFHLTAQEKYDMTLLARGIRLMAAEDGGFWYIYYLTKEENIITSYGSGEALFALAKYYDYENNEEGLRWTYEAFKKYYGRYLESETDFNATEARGFFSWGIYALSILDKNFHIDFNNTVKPLLDMAFDKRESNFTCKRRGCILELNAGDIPFYEGMIQAYILTLKYAPESRYKDMVGAYLDLAASDFADLQVSDMKEFKADHDFFGKEKYVMGGVCWDMRCYQMRNDMTQHLLSAFIHHADYFCLPDGQGTLLEN